MHTYNTLGCVHQHIYTYTCVATVPIRSMHNDNIELPSIIEIIPIYFFLIIECIPIYTMYDTNHNIYHVQGMRCL